MLWLLLLGTPYILLVFLSLHLLRNHLSYSPKRLVAGLFLRTYDKCTYTFMLPITIIKKFLKPPKPPAPKQTVSSTLADYLNKKATNQKGNCGLINVGNSCYINSVLQVISLLILELGIVAILREMP